MSFNKYKGVAGTDNYGQWFRERDGGVVFNWFMEGVVGRIGNWMFEAALPYSRFYEVSGLNIPLTEEDVS